MPLHSSLDDGARLHLKKKREREKKDEHVEKQESGHALGSWKSSRGRAAWDPGIRSPHFRKLKSSQQRIRSSQRDRRSPCRTVRKPRPGRK